MICYGNEYQVPSQPTEAEAHVLGSMILLPSAIDVVVQINRPEHFFRPAHRLLFAVLVEMRSADKPIDLVYIRDALLGRSQLQLVGGIDYLVALVQGVPAVTDIESFANIVRKNATLGR